MYQKVKILCLAIVAISLLGCSKTHRRAAFPSYVEVQGTAEQDVTPDVFYISFSLNETGQAKGNQVGAMEQRLLAALKTLNIDTKTDLSVTNMWGNKWYWWRNKNNPVYQSKTYLLKLNDSLLGKVCDKLDSLNVEYNLSKVDYSKIDDIKKQVQQEAVKQARQQADNLLSGENKKAGDLIYLQEQDINNQVNNRNFNEYQMDKADDASIEPPDFQKMTVSYSVIARFSIK